MLLPCTGHSGEHHGIHSKTDDPFLGHSWGLGHFHVAMVTTSLCREEICVGQILMGPKLSSARRHADSAAPTAIMHRSPGLVLQSQELFTVQGKGQER